MEGGDRDDRRGARSRTRRQAGRRRSRPRGIDDLDSLDALETLDWSTDPWDDAEVAGVVERLRWQTRSIKWVAYAAMVLVVALILAAGGVGWWYIHQLNPEGETGAPASFTVDAADTLDSLSDRLEQDGFIVDAGVFRWYVERHGGLEITPGYYEITTSDHMGNVLATLRTPPAQTYNKVTFPEGFTMAQMAQRLDEKVVPMTADGFNAAMQDPALVANFRPFGVTSLEGLLFPDTYQVSNGESEGQVISRMISQMERVGSQEDIVTKGERLFQSPYGILTIASMIERERRRTRTGRRSPGSSTTGWASACRWPSTQPCATGRCRRASTRTRCRSATSGTWTLRGTRTCTKACHPRRSPTLGGRRSRPRSIRRPTRASVTRSAPTCPRTHPVSTSST